MNAQINGVLRPKDSTYSVKIDLDAAYVRGANRYHAEETMFPSA